MELHIVVIMPDHAHLVFTPLVDQDRLRMFPISEILQPIKSASAHQVNKLLQRHGAVWQDEYFDHVIRHSESLEQKIQYVRENPVRAGLVLRAEDYQWTWEQPRPRAAAAPKVSGN